MFRNFFSIEAMPKKHDPFAALDEQPVKKRSFLSSLFGSKDTSKKNEKESSPEPLKGQYKSPFRSSNTPKKQRPSDSLPDTYKAPDLQKKSKTPKDFKPGTKLTQTLPDKPPRRFSLKNVFLTNRPLAPFQKPEPVLEEKEEPEEEASVSKSGANEVDTPKKVETSEEKPSEQKAALVKSIKDEAGVDDQKEAKDDVNDARAQAVAEAEKQLVGESKPEDELQSVVSEKPIEETPAKEELKAAVQPEQLESSSSNTNREAVVVGGVVGSPNAESQAGAVPEAIDEEPEEDNLVKKEVTNTPIADLKEVDVGAGLKLPNTDILDIAHSKVAPVLDNLDENAKEQQKKDKEYEAQKKAELQEKHEAKLRKLKEKNAAKYTQKEQKYDSKIKELQDKITALETQIKSAREQHAKDLEELEKAHKESLEKEADKFEKDKEFLLKEHELLRAKKEKEIEQLIEDQKQTALDIRLTESRTAELESKSKVLELDIQDLEEDRADKTAELNALQKKLEAEEANVADLRNALARTSEAIANESAKQAELDAIVEETKKKIAEVEAELGEYDTRLAALKADSEERKKYGETLKLNLAKQKEFEKQLQSAKTLREDQIKKWNTADEKSAEAVVKPVPNEFKSETAPADPADEKAESTGFLKLVDEPKTDLAEPKVEAVESKVKPVEPKSNSLEKTVVDAIKTPNPTPIVNEDTVKSQETEAVTPEVSTSTQAEENAVEKNEASDENPLESSVVEKIEDSGPDPRSRSKSITEFPVTAPKSTVAEEEPSAKEIDTEIDTVLEKSLTSVGTGDAEFKTPETTENLENDASQTEAVAVTPEKKNEKPKSSNKKKNKKKKKKGGR